MAELINKKTKGKVLDAVRKGVPLDYALALVHADMNDYDSADWSFRKEVKKAQAEFMLFAMDKIYERVRSGKGHAAAIKILENIFPYHFGGRKDNGAVETTKVEKNVNKILDNIKEEDASSQTH